MEHDKLEEYKTIVKGELKKIKKQQLEKIYSSEKIEEQISVQRPSYDRIGLGYLLGQLAKKLVERKGPNLKLVKVKEDLNQIESSQFADVP